MILQIDNQSLRAPLTLTGSWSLASLLLKTTLKIFLMAIVFLGDGDGDGDNHLPPLLASLCVETVPLAVINSPE